MFFVADEHYGHKNIIKYNDRPFSDIKDMDESIIKGFNKKVPSNAVTIHAGDFCLGSRKYEVVKERYIDQLNGDHVFLLGSHDHWLPNSRTHEIIEITIGGQTVVVCHYAMRVWSKSHYGSWHLYGHSHGHLPSIGKSHDISLDNTFFLPLSWVEVKKIMDLKPDNKPNH